MPGLEQYGRAQALEALFNLSATTYVGLLEVLPIDGSGEVEISPPLYSRVLVQDWTTNEDSGTTSRCNVNAVGFGPYPVDVAIRGWAIWDAPLGGNLIASGLFFDTGGGQAGEVFVDTGDDIQFQPGDFCIALNQDCPVVFNGDGDGDGCPQVLEVRIYDNTNPLLPVLLTTKGPGDPAYFLGFNANLPIKVEIDLDQPITIFEWTQTYADGDTPDPPTAQSYLSPTWTLEYVHPLPGGLGNQIITRHDQTVGGSCTFTENLTVSQAV